MAVAASTQAGGDRRHLSLVVCGHVDAGKSTTTGRLIYELGGLSEREMQKLKAEAKVMQKESFFFAFATDQQEEERRRGLTIACSTKEFYTSNYHYTIIDAPGHKDFIKNMITGASQADVALIMVPADGNFTAAIAKGNHKAGEVQGQTRQHARLINILGIKQIIVGVNKMDCDVAKYSQERFDEVADEMRRLLIKVGFKKEFVQHRVPFLPLSGFRGDNLLQPSANMKWWQGVKVAVDGKKHKVHVRTLVDALNEMVQPPEHDLSKPLRMPVGGVYTISGVGTVLAGRLEQGTVKAGDEVAFPPTHTAANAAKGKVFSVEMHKKAVARASAGDNVGLCIRGLSKINMPRIGDIMVGLADGSVAPVKSFVAQVQVLDHPGQLKVGYTPIAFVRTARAPVRLEAIRWKVGKSTGGSKVEHAAFLQRGEVAEVLFAPQVPFVVDTFQGCEGLGRVALMEGNGVVMLGKITQVQH